MFLIDGVEVLPSEIGLIFWACFGQEKGGYSGL